MTKTCQILLAGLISLAVSAPIYAQNPQNAMIDFYRGMTDIVKNNMDNPQACVAEIGNYVQKNATVLKDAASNIQNNTKQAGGQIDEKEMEKVMTDLMNSEFMEVIQKFSQAFGEFAEKNPDYADKIAEAFSGLGPQAPGN